MTPARAGVGKCRDHYDRSMTERTINIRIAVLILFYNEEATLAVCSSHAGVL
jgi:hypothetical protein